MISSKLNRLSAQSANLTHQGAVHDPLMRTPLLYVGRKAVSAETFLQPLSETTIDAGTVRSDAHDGIRGDGESLPRFALRLRQNSIQFQVHSVHPNDKDKAVPAPPGHRHLSM